MQITKIFRTKIKTKPMYTELIIRKNLNEIEQKEQDKWLNIRKWTTVNASIKLSVSKFIQC